MPSIKTRESLRTIKTFDRAKALGQKVKNGAGEVKEYGEELQNTRYESANEYAGNAVENTERRTARNVAYGAGKIGNWGLKETQKNILKWRNRPKKCKVKVQQPKQLPAPKHPALPPAKTTAKTAQKGVKTAQQTAKAAAKTAKVTVKAAQRAAQAAKAAAKATAKFVKVAAKAIVAAVKAAVAAIKGIVAAIVAGGWVAVLIIVIVVIVALVVGSVYAIFVPAEDSGITIYSVKADLEREYHQRQSELIANCQCDILNYEGDISSWEEMIAVYAVKLNLGDEPQEVATFDEDKADELREIFWDMNTITLHTETRTTTVTRYETDANGNLVEVQENVTMIILTVMTDGMSADEAATLYGFNAKQNEMLDELLSAENAELWAGILGE